MKRFVFGIWEFIVGDDPLVALGVVLALGLTAALSAWWLMPVAIVLLFADSLRRAAR